MAKGLISQAHEVSILTSRHQLPPENNNHIEILAYFSKWSLWEGIKIIPTLLGLKPAVLHLILEEKKTPPAALVLAAFADKNPDCVFALSFLNALEKISRKSVIKNLLDKSDIVTFPTPDSINSLVGLHIQKHAQNKLVFSPILPAIPPQGLEAEESEPQQLKEKSRPQAVVYFAQNSFDENSLFFKSLKILSSKFDLIFYGDNTNWPLRERKKFSAWLNQIEAHWQFNSLVNPSEIIQKMSSADIIFTAFTSISISQLAEWMVASLHSRAALVMEHSQTGVYAGLWRQGKNCWILQKQKNLKDLIFISEQSSALPYPRPSQSTNSQQLVDTSLNELNRLYNKALLQLR